MIVVLFWHWNGIVVCVGKRVWGEVVEWNGKNKNYFVRAVILAINHSVTPLLLL